STEVVERVKAASPARQFFLLSSIVAEPFASFSDVSSDELSKKRVEARKVLIRHQRAPAGSTEDDPNPALISCGSFETTAKAECTATRALARQCAGEVERGYAEAFSISLGASGAQVPVDLRNWLAIVPP